MESLLGSEDPMTWQSLAHREDPLKKYKTISPTDWEEIKKEVAQDLPVEWTDFHEAFQAYKHPGPGHWGRIPSKTYLKQVWKPYKDAKLPDIYFPIMATGEYYYVLTPEEEVLCTYDNKIVAKDLFSWVKNECQDMHE